MPAQSLVRIRTNSSTSMKPKFLSGLVASSFVALSHGQLTINEIDSNTPGIDAAEFVELFDGGSGGTSLDGHVLVFFSGSDDESYASFDLTGQVTNSSGYFVIGNVPEADLVFPGATNQLQNGADAVALYQDVITSFPDDTPVTATNLVDAIVYGTSDGDDAELLATFGGEQADEAAGGDDNNESIQRNPDGSTNFNTALPTPGSSNDMDPILEAIFDTLVVSEDAGAEAIFVDVVTPEPVSTDLVLNISISDGTELAGPITEIIPAGDDFIFFELDAVDDALVDGNQSVTVTISAAGFQDAVQTIVVTDNELSLPAIVINEMRAKSFNVDDPEFVEIFNDSNFTVNLGGWSVSAFESDSEDPLFGQLQGTFTIPEGASSQLSPGDFFLVGNSFFADAFGTEPDFEADFDFGDDDITMILFNAAGFPVYTVLSTDGGSDILANNATSPVAADITIGPDITAVGTFSPAGFLLDTDGGSTATLLSFDAVPDPLATPGSSNESPILQLQVEVDTSLFSENAGAAVATATVTRFNSTTGPLTVNVTSSDLSEVVIQTASLQFASGEATQTVLLDAVDDADLDGLQTVVITATASGFLDGTATVSVTDDDTPLADLVINEMIIDSDGADTEFLEIFNAGNVDVNLAGYSIERWESDAGQTGMDGGGPIELPLGNPIIIPAGGFFLIANDAFVAAYPGVTVDLMATGSFENSSATIVLRDANANVIYSVFATDGGVGDVANIDGTPIVPDLVANDIAFALAEDGGTTFVVIDNSVPSSDATPGSSNGLAPAPIFEVAITDCSVINGNFVINFTATGLSDVYVTTDLESFNLSTNGASVVSGVYTDTAPPAGRGFYLIQEAGSPAP